MDIIKGLNTMTIVKLFLHGFILLIISTEASAGIPKFVRDLNSDPIASSGVKDLCSEFVEYNDSYYFCANSLTGPELWSSDGTNTGTVRISSNYAPKELAEYSGKLIFVDETTGGLYESDGSATGISLVMDFSRATLLTEVDGKLLFLGDNGVSGLELWSTDGTPAGTSQLADIRSGSSGFSFDFNSSDISKVGEKVFFTIDDNANGEELWVTQGTAASTVLVKDIYPGPASSRPSELVPLGNKITFFAKNEDGQDLWISDGTEVGTINLTSFGASLIIGFCGGTKSIAHDSILYFCARGGLEGTELWSTDGTVNGTKLVKDINPEFNSNPDFLQATATHVFFTANGSNTSLRDLWVTDGSSAGTYALTTRQNISLQDIYALSEQSGEILFIGELDIQGVGLWVTDLVNQGVSLIKDFDTQIGVYTEFSNSFTKSDTELLGSSDNYDYFILDVERNTPTSLWRTDSSTGGTTKIGDFPSLGSSLDPENTRVELFFPTPQNVFFAADDPDQSQVSRIWKDDGSALTILKEIQPTDQIPTKSAVMSKAVEFEDHFYFLTSDISGSPGISLWRSDGAGENTIQIEELCSLHCDIENAEIVATSRGVFILVKNQYLWFTDGTSSANLIKQVGDSDFGTLNRANKLTVLGSNVVFVGWNANQGLELWRSDGSTQGTVIVKDIQPGLGSGFRAGASGTDRLDDLTDFAVISNTVFFVANDGQTGPELWRSRGTASSTKLVKDIFTLGNLGSYPQDITAIGNTLFFSAFTLDTGYELWKSSGNASSTVLVKDIEPETFTVQVTRFICETVAGIEICQDRLVEEERPYSSLPKGITKLGNKAIFRAYTREQGYETWVSDGSFAGTFILRDIWPGTIGSSNLVDPPTDGDFEEDVDNIRRLKKSVIIDDELFFAAKRRTGKIQLWKTDGTSAGTRLIREIGNINFSAEEIEEFAVNTNGTNSFYFTVKADTNDSRLWQYNGFTKSAFEFSDHPTPPLTNPNKLFFFNSELYFSADNGIKGRSLWMIVTDSDSDGISDKIDPDDDNDGMPDAFELAYGLNPLDPSDAMLDPDGDGRDNLTEYRQRTNPLVFDDARPFVIAPIIQLLLDE